MIWFNSLLFGTEEEASENCERISFGLRIVPKTSQGCTFQNSVENFGRQSFFYDGGVLARSYFEGYGDLLSRLLFATQKMVRTGR